MNAHAPQRRPGLFGRPILTITIVLAVLVGAGLGGMALANRNSDTPVATWQPAIRATASSATPSAPAAAPESDDTFTFSATGDIIMGSAPGKLPANDGDGFFDSVREGLKSDLVMGNLEQPLTTDTGT